VVPAVNRLAKIVESLEKCGINTSNASTISILQRLAKNDRNLEVGSVSTELALSTYYNVKDAAGTETKSCIGSEIGMKVNGSVFPEFPFILSAHDAADAAKLVKILRVPDGATSLSIRQQDVKYEAESVKFVHHSIVPMERTTINIDSELARKVNCRVGVNEVLIMPWYTSTLNLHPSNCLDWIGIEGRRIFDALQYLHDYPDGGFAHMDVKAMNIFVDHANHCFLGDFGSCKPIGNPITSCSIAFCWEDVRGQTAHPKYDYFMLLVMVLIECLEDRRTYNTTFYDVGAQFVSVSKVVAAAQSRIELESTPGSLAGLLAEVMHKMKEFGVS
jgi:serine/threonine protein kinase